MFNHVQVGNLIDKRWGHHNSDSSTFLSTSRSSIQSKSSSASNTGDTSSTVQPPSPTTSNGQQSPSSSPSSSLPLSVGELPSGSGSNSPTNSAGAPTSVGSPIVSTGVTSVPVTTFTSGSSTFTSFSATTYTTTSPAPSSSGTSLPQSGSLNAGSQPICIGNGLDIAGVGILSSLIIPSAIGLLLWLIFAVLRPRFRQVYAVREWFSPQDQRPRPLRDTLWAFLFPHVPMVPSVPTGTSQDDEKGLDPNEFPSDGQISQRVLWVSFLLALGWAVLGLLGALPLYLVNTPCLAQSTPAGQFGGIYSTLQDLSLLRLLPLLANGTVSTSSGKLQQRAVVDGDDVTRNVKIRLIILTVLVLALALLPALYKILREFTRLANYYRRWVEVRCGGIEMGWLSAKDAPGFVGWGEKRLKDYIVKMGLSASLGNGVSNSRNLAGIGSGIGAAGRNRRTRKEESESPLKEEEKGKLEVDVQSVFSIADTHLLALLIDERDRILNNLEIAESRYIYSFRLASPEPSVTEFPVPPEEANDLKRQISRPRVLGAGARRGRRGRQDTGDSNNAPTSYVAPSQYYKLRHVQGISGGRLSDDEDTPTFGDTVRSRVVGTRFQEVNRDSLAYGRLPLGSRLAVNKGGELSSLPSSPDPRMYGPNHGTEPSSADPDTSRVASTSSPWGRFSQDPSTPLRGPSSSAYYDSPSPGRQESAAAVEDEDIGAVPRVRHADPAPPEHRETFAMRTNGHGEPETTQLPPHLRLQPQQPFVRPISGLDHDDLGDVYSDIREWRSRLKAINADIMDAQNDCYNDIADGVRIKGWLITGRGVRFLPGIQMIEGRSKEDVRWDELQHEGGQMAKISFWIVVAVTAVILGAALAAVAGLFVATAPDVAHFLPFLRPLLTTGKVASGLATVLAPAVAASLFIAFALLVVHYASRFDGSVSWSKSQMTAYKATFVILTVMASVWLVAVGAVIFSLDAFDKGTNRPQSVADGSIYISALMLSIVLTVAVISPALLLLQPIRLWRVVRSERQAVTPRQRFRAVYPRTYDPSYATGCCVLGLVFASTFALIFPLIGPAVAILLFLTLVANRFLVGYVYGRTNAQIGGKSQLWLLKRFGTIICFQPILLGLIFLSRRLWIEGGILIGIAITVIILVEIYAHRKTKVPGIKSLSPITRNSLESFGKSARPGKRRSVDEEGTSLVTSQRSRTRGSIASVLEMMSVTLAVMPSPQQNRGPVPLETEALDDLTTTERAARTHPDAPPHLPPLAFTDHAEEMASILYAPELIAPPPTIWLPNDAAGIARSEAYDLQRYHSLRTTLDVRSTADVLTRRSSSSRSRRHAI
ncbi:hypothetical protein BD410DRAFT_759887 [Rickenella mellea]|uniref:CSC1/OSCA1-like 7TM region domain-containing protein n=1 Tax=Rickenella mellea TaxID=50990 RepID=A0A4Y7QMF3_9AGAM|nr:hypothetical protein BD410DRAFT_759887 [Rickenella mellea]